MTRLLAIGALAFAGCQSSRYLCETIPPDCPRQIVFVQESSEGFGRDAHYEISDAKSGRLFGKVRSSIGADERGVDGRRLRAGRDFAPVAAVSLSGDTILVVEDCWDAVPACKHLLIQLSTDAMRSRYIAMPVKSSIPPYPTPPAIMGLTDDVVRFQFIADEVREMPLSEFR